MSYLMVGSGEPPELEHERLSSRPSWDCAWEPGFSTGARGPVSTVSAWPCACSVRPDPPAFTRHSNRPLSRSYDTFDTIRSKRPSVGLYEILQQNNRFLIPKKRSSTSTIPNGFAHYFPGSTDSSRSYKEQKLQCANVNVFP